MGNGLYNVEGNGRFGLSCGGGRFPGMVAERKEKKPLKTTPDYAEAGAGWMAG